MTYESLKPWLFKIEPENAHNLAEFALRSLNALSPCLIAKLANKFIIDDESLKQNLCGINFNNIVGLAGGFDKNATMIKPLAALGFGFLEFGTFTPKAQSGNERPRLFRLIEEQSLQNAMGFNNQGSEKIASRLAKIYPFCTPLGANIGKNKSTPNEEAISDYLKLLRSFDNLCDYFIINISSPNTQGLRDLQSVKFIENLLNEAKKITQKPIFVKIAPDMQISSAIELCQNAINFGASGLIIANTSIDYSLIDNKRTFGGLSGQIIAKKSSEFFLNLAKELFGKTILIASGGINSAQSAYERIKNGANLVQIYTSFIYNGPSIAKDINLGVLDLLKKDGFDHISKAVGANLK